MLQVNRLRDIRRERGIPQQAQAVQAGVSPSLLVMIERWGYRPTAVVQSRIARVLGCSATDYLSFLWTADHAKVPILIAYSIQR